MEALTGKMANISSQKLKFSTGIIIFLIFFCLLVNVGQYTYGFGIESNDGWTLAYGIPFAYYEYVPALNRGRVLYLGAFGNLFFAIILGLTISRLLLVKKNDK